MNRNQQPPDETRAALLPLDDEVKNALLEAEHLRIFVHAEGKNARIELHRSWCCQRFTLTDADPVPENLPLLITGLTEQEDGYLLLTEEEDWSKDPPRTFSIRFTGARMEVIQYAVPRNPFADNPWTMLAFFAECILQRCRQNSGNAREQAALPMIKELLSLRGNAPGFDSEFSQLKAYARLCGCESILPLFDQLKANLDKPRKKSALQKKLNRAEYEPLWRMIHRVLTESQAEYPSRAEALCPKELLEKTRSQIQESMRAQGYEGQYPDFVKRGETRGARLAQSYGVGYLIFREKRAAYHIHCDETVRAGCLTIDFLCGANFCEDPGDVYSCLFNAKGRRFFQNISYEGAPVDSPEKEPAKNLEHWTRFAVKKAELRSLTKKERRELVGFDIPFWIIFIIFIAVFIPAGGLFSLCMILGFVLLSVLIGLAAGQAGIIPSLLTEFPYWKMLCLCWILFGGVMGVISVLIKRK